MWEETVAFVDLHWNCWRCFQWMMWVIVECYLSTVYTLTLSRWFRFICGSMQFQSAILPAWFWFQQTAYYQLPLMQENHQSSLLNQTVFTKLSPKIRILSESTKCCPRKERSTYVVVPILLQELMCTCIQFTSCLHYNEAVINYSKHSSGWSTVSCLVNAAPVI